MSAPPGLGRAFQVGILLGGRDWASCCPFLLSQLCVQQWTRLSETLAGLSLPLSSLLTGTLAYLPPAHLHLSPGQDAPAWCWPHGPQ